MRTSKPTDEASAERVVAPYRRLSPADRWRAFAELLREMESLLGQRTHRAPDEHPFWRHWTDPFLGRPL
jgi:hypothetical protein